MADFEQLESACKRYVAQFNAFLDHHHAVRSLVGQAQLHHVAHKVVSPEGYESAVREFSRYGRVIGELADSGRGLSLLALYKPFFSTLGPIGFFEVMQPRPGTTGPEGFVLDHAEYVVGDLGPVKKAARADGIRFEPEKNGAYHWISFSFGKKQEVRFTTTRLDSLVG